jgi:hypothetical protein
MHKQQLGTENVWDICQLMNRRKEASVLLDCVVPMAFAAAPDDSCSSSKNTKHRHSSNWCRRSLLNILPFTKVQVSSIMDGTSDDDIEMSGRIIVGH